MCLMPCETVRNFWEKKPKTTAQVSGKTELRTEESQFPTLVVPERYMVLFWFKGEVLHWMSFRTAHSLLSFALRGRWSCRTQKPISPCGILSRTWLSGCVCWILQGAGPGVTSSCSKPRRSWVSVHYFLFTLGKKSEILGLLFFSESFCFSAHNLLRHVGLYNSTLHQGD